MVEKTAQPSSKHSPAGGMPDVYQFPVVGAWDVTLREVDGLAPANIRVFQFADGTGNVYLLGHGGKLRKSPVQWFKDTTPFSAEPAGYLETGHWTLSVTRLV